MSSDFYVFDRRRITIFGVLLGVILLASACGGGKEPAPGQEASSPNEEPSTPGTFTSPVYGYSVDYPDGWAAYEAKRSLYSYESPLPGAPSVDTFKGPGRASIVVAAEPEAGRTLGQWAAHVIEEVRGVSCEPDATEGVTVGGEPARLIEQKSCEGFHSLWTVVVHRERVFHIIWFNTPGSDAADRALFDEALETFTFIE